MKNFKIKEKSPINSRKGFEAMQLTIIKGIRATVIAAAVVLSCAQSNLLLLAQQNLPTKVANTIKVKSYTIDEPGNSRNDVLPTKQKVRQDYKLRVGDQLEFSLLNTEYKFTNPVTIDNQGTVFLDHLEWVRLQGKTVREAQDDLKKSYEQDFFTNPRVKLTLIKKANVKFKILGQVANPGFYEVPPGLDIDILDAIAIAGGYTRIAGKVTFKAPTLEGKTKIETYKLKELTKGDAVLPKLDGDETIIIGESIF